MFEWLSFPFMQRAFIAGGLIGFLASYYGVFVVQRGLSFLGSGLAHAAFGGIALGLLLESEPLWFGIIFTVLVAIAIVWVKEHTQLGNDTSVGIFFAVSMALGIIFLFFKQEYTNNTLTYLFGSILAVTETDIWAATGMVFITILCWPFWKRWGYASFDRELAQTDRLPVLFDDYLLSILIAITVVIAIKIVGIVLIAAFLVIPAATARLISHTLFRMTIISTLTGVVSALLGLLASYYLDVPSGATIVLLQALLFFMSIFMSKLSSKLFSSI